MSAEPKNRSIEARYLAQTVPYLLLLILCVVVPVVPVALAIIDALYVMVAYSTRNSFKRAFEVLLRKNEGPVGAATVVVYPIRVVSHFLWAVIVSILMFALSVIIVWICTAILLALAGLFAGIAGWILAGLRHGSTDAYHAALWPIFAAITAAITNLTFDIGDNPPARHLYEAAHTLVKQVAQKSEIILVIFFGVTSIVTYYVVTVGPHLSYWPLPFIANAWW